ncbi:helix-turn-helix domain-containing protein [Streptomyces chrestomyceticus]|uniref:helix-turn-helix domain-containing protein n=1 Tax=Streptomyces chrestomyceticus TaxID=68185 RepID=UPI00378AD9A2
MFGSTVAEHLTAYRHRLGLEADQVAHAAGLAVERYRLLEEGTGWPGTRAFHAVLEALQIQGPQRDTFAFPGTPLDPLEQQFLTGNSNQVWLHLDHGWTVVAAGDAVPATAVPLPEPGDNFLRWLLCDPDLPGRLLNHEALAAAARHALRTAAVADPDHPALRTLREQFPDDDPDVAPASRALDRTNWIWRTPEGPYLVWQAISLRPSFRPDVRFLFFQADEKTSAPSPTRPPQTAAVPAPADQPAGNWQAGDPVLAGLLLCGHCHQTMTAPAETAAYQCPDHCISLAAEQATDRVGQVLTARLFTEESVRKLALAQEMILAAGIDMAHPLPVNARHALHQWRHSMTDTVRRGFATEQIASVTVAPGPAPELTVLWRDSTHTTA